MKNLRVLAVALATTLLLSTPLVAGAKTILDPDEQQAVFNVVEDEVQDARAGSEPAAKYTHGFGVAFVARHFDSIMEALADSSLSAEVKDKLEAFNHGQLVSLFAQMASTHDTEEGQVAEANASRGNKVNAEKANKSAYAAKDDDEDSDTEEEEDQPSAQGNRAQSEEHKANRGQAKKAEVAGQMPDEPKVKDKDDEKETQGAGNSAGQSLNKGHEKKTRGASSQGNKNS